MGNGGLEDIGKNDKFYWQKKGKVRSITKVRKMRVLPIAKKAEKTNNIKRTNWR